jgi:transglutaminase-like putative cysteine protease
MTPVAVVTPDDLTRTPARATVRPRVWMRTLSFAALAFYGVQRWSELMRDPPAGRLAALAGVAVALAVLVPLARRLAGAWPAPLRRCLTGVLAGGLGVGALAIAGLRSEWVIDVRIAVCARAIGHGLGSLGGVLVPYLGHDHSIRLVMTLGAAILLLDAAAALAYAGGVGSEMSDGRRAAAALPLIALAVVPATLVPPSSAPLQGLTLFALLALFMWGERIGRDGAAAAIGVACVTGIAAVIVGPLIASSHAWVDYRAWAGGAGATGVEHFSWNQSYGPLDWPQDGRVVLTVHAREGEYWKAEDLTRFDGTDWVAAGAGGAGAPALPAPGAAVRRRYSEPVTVALDDIDTREVIGGSGASSRPQLAGGVSRGAVPGTWIARRELEPGDAYTVESYSPAPSAVALERARGYPWSRLAPDLSLTLPERAGAHPQLASVTFPAFHEPLPATITARLAASPYAPALTLARRLAAGARTPYGFMQAVRGYLDDGQYTYDQSTAPSADPLVWFLFTTRVGYCQQFSGAMAMLLRMGGVPARVAAGFTSGTLHPGAHTWTVTDIDAHAWVEAWFPGYGWVREDPTPAGAPALGSTGGPVVLPNGTGETPHQRSLAESAAPHLSSHPTAAAGGHGGRSGGGGSPRGAHQGASVGPWPWIGAGVMVALVLALGAGVARRTRSRHDPLSELERALARTGRPLRDGVTLAALERRFHDSPEAAAYIRALRLGRYGAGNGTDGTPTAAGRRALRAQLRAELGATGWLRALWALPPRPPRPSL